MEIEINGEKYYRNDTRTLQEASRVLFMNVIVDINEYDMVEVKILKNGGKPIPGNGRIGSDMLVSSYCYGFVWSFG